MNIDTNETHHRVHHVTLSQTEVETILKDAIRRQIPALSKRTMFNVRWTEETYDSGLAKRPQIKVEIIEDLSPDQVPDPELTKL
jgi:hypothetical protein